MMIEVEHTYSFYKKIYKQTTHPAYNERRRRRRRKFTTSVSGKLEKSVVLIIH